MNEFEELMLSEMRGMRDEVRDTRDGMGELKTDLATFKTTTNAAIVDITNKQKWSTRLYTVVGGAIAVAISKYMGH